MPEQTREPRTIVKRVPAIKNRDGIEEGGAILYSDGSMLVMNVRLSYPNVFKPFESTDQDGNKKLRYGTVGLMPKTRAYAPAKDLIKAEITRIMAEHKLKYNELAADRKFLKDGDQSGKAENEGMFTVSAGETRKPSVRDRYRDPKTGKPKVLVAGQDDDRIYGGCWGNIWIRPWWQANKWGKRVNAGLVGVQFVRDDEAFGQGRITEEEIDETFDEFADDADSGFDDSLGDELPEL